MAADADRRHDTVTIYLSPAPSGKDISHGGGPEDRGTLLRLRMPVVVVLCAAARAPKLEESTVGLRDIETGT